MRTFAKAWFRNGWAWGEMESATLAAVLFVLAALTYASDPVMAVEMAYLSGLFGLISVTLGIAAALRRMRSPDARRRR